MNDFNEKIFPFLKEHYGRLLICREFIYHDCLKTHIDFVENRLDFEWN